MFEIRHVQPENSKSRAACTSRCFCDCFTSTHVSRCPYDCRSRRSALLPTLINRSTHINPRHNSHTWCLFARHPRREIYSIFLREWKIFYLNACKYIRVMFNYISRLLRFLHDSKPCERKRSLKWYIYA